MVLTFLEAVDSLESNVAKLGIKYPDGQPMEPVVAMGRIGAYHGARYDGVLNRLTEGQITVEQYFLEMMRMIHEYVQRNREI